MPTGSFCGMIAFADLMLNEFSEHALVIARHQRETAEDQSVAAVWNVISEHLSLRLGV